LIGHVSSPGVQFTPPGIPVIYVAGGKLIRLARRFATPLAPI